MKKLYFILSGFVLSLSTTFAQTTTFEVCTQAASTTPIANNAFFDVPTNAAATKSYHFIMRNTTASTQTYTMRKDDISLHTISASDYAEAYFCTGLTCYVPSVYNAAFTVAAMSDFDITVYLVEASAIGQSTVGYKFENGSEQLVIQMRYNYSLGVKNNMSAINNVSAVYPNPSVSKSFIDVTSTQELNTTMYVYNCLGSLVSTKQVGLKQGKNTLSLESDGLETGIYFVKIGNGSATITRKLTVTK